MAYTSADRTSDQSPLQAANRHTPVSQFVDSRPSTAAQLKLQSLMQNAPQAAAQLRLQDSMQSTAQRMEEDELQGKFVTAQRMEDEDLLQGKFETAQRMEEDELQGKFVTAQRMEEEEPLQGKFEAVQKVEDEDLLQGKFAAAPSSSAIVQREEKPNNTGLPNQLKAGIESLSGMSMDHVKVHYNSDKPAQLNAHAYAQGSDIHVAPGQEQHLAHEAWHVVQQAQGRVKPTMQMKAGVPVNDDVGLETEADVMGAKALQLKTEVVADSAQMKFVYRPQQAVQLRALFKPISVRVDTHMKDGWGANYGITTAEHLAAKVKPEKGSGTINLGAFAAPATETAERGNFSKNCSIIYEDKSEGSGKFKTNYTNVTHCGPSGSPIR